MQFVDRCNLLFKAGDGGNGMIAWRREAHVEFGGPAGGDGGDGGSIYLLADHNENTLFNLRNIKTVKAENGVNGQSENKTGAKGADKVVKVPVGTVVYDENNNVIVDLNQDKQLFLIAKGGKGGKGNASFKSPSNKAPSMYDFGDLGDELKVTLELKYLADIGIIGLPNAGKSTFLKTVCNVDVKVANYPFTTIKPVLGTYYFNDQKVVFCDIPGLIEGASEGKGLGHEFLKHIERCSILVHLVSGSIEDNEDIISAYNTINNELKQYSEAITKKLMVIAVTKSDTEFSEKQYLQLKEYLKNKKVFFISCLNGSHLNEFLDEIKRVFILSQNKKSIDNETTVINDLKTNEINLTNFKEETSNNYSNIDDEQLDISYDENNMIHVCHPIINYWTHKIPHDTKDNIYRFNTKMQYLELDKVLKKHDLNQDDVVYLGKENIEWIID